MIKKYLYTIVHDKFEAELCKLELKYIFNQEDENKLLFSDLKVEPSHSAFLKNRLDIITYSEDYNTLIQNIKKENICIEGFKVEYKALEGDNSRYKDKLGKLKDIGYSIDGIPDYHNPTTTYVLCRYHDIWLFGLKVKNSYEWNKHKSKPYSYSNSINIHIAKALVNIASKGNKENKLLDACCGVGTIMLEACFAGYNIEGCDINWKICRQARENLAHFNYDTRIYRTDIKDMSKNYDAAIIDLPYNLFSEADENTALHIIESTTKLAGRLIIVSSFDIKSITDKLDLNLTDFCSVGKSGKKHFTRKIWVCESKKS